MGVWEQLPTISEDKKMNQEPFLQDKYMRVGRPYCILPNPNVLFACGCIPDYQKDRIRVYYRATDSRIGLATGSLREFD